jgi:hypothetical protein
MSTIKDWDRLAAETINSVLAPKGFGVVENGHWRGSIKAKSDHPFLSKKKVIEARGVAAMMVRNYREGIRFELTDRMQKAQKNWDEASIDLRSCKFWEVSNKRIFKKNHDHFRDQVGLLQILINELDNIKIRKPQ